LEELHERLYPSYLVHHRIFPHEEISAHSFRPRLPIDPLGISTIVPIAAGPAVFEPAQATRILDAMGKESNNRFVSDSFGLWGEATGGSYPAYLREYGHVLTLVADDDAQPRGAFVRPPDEAVASASELLKALGHARFSPVSVLSSMCAPRLEIAQSPWVEGFNIIVGDSFADRLTFWNARLHFPKWRDSAFVDLRIPARMLDDHAFISGIGEFLKRFNRVGDGGQTRAILRSSSVSPDLLERLAIELRAIHKWSIFEVGTFAAVDDCVPTPEQLDHSHFLQKDRAPRSLSVWRETPYQEAEVRISPPTPDHLRADYPALQYPSRGAWIVDIQLERHNNHSNYQRSQHWILPRRLRMTSAFAINYELEGSYGRTAIPRVSREGWLTLYANSALTLPVINEPDDQVAFSIALTRGRDWSSPASDRQFPRQLCQAVTRSENGRYFWGVLQIFGGLKEANQFLLNQFWREQFDVLGASSSTSQARLDVVERTLQNRFRAGSVNIRNQSDLNRLTKIVLQESEHYRTFIPKLSWEELKKSFESNQKRHWQQYPAEADVDEAEWKEHELENFTREVMHLCRIGVIHQGLEHKCEKCLHRSWIRIDAVNREVACEVCGTADAAPVSRPWEFRLNEFVREALRKHGILPLFWTLKRLREFHEESFFFEGPLDIYLEQLPWEAAGPDGDLDLVSVSNGRVCMCEVKQSARQLRKAQDFSNVIRQLRPNVGVISVMEPETPYVRQEFERFSEELRGTGIDTLLLTLRNGDFSEGL
jgi:hypothetical protein